MCQESFPTWKGYLFRLQQEAPTPKPIVCRRKEVNFCRPQFYGEEYHGFMDRKEGEALCSEEGNFLIRESKTDHGRYTLVLRILNAVKNFKLYYENEKHFVGEKMYDSLYQLVEDGLITLFVENKAQDYIENMSLEPIYSSLNRYSSTGSIRRSAKTLHINPQQSHHQISLPDTDPYFNQSCNHRSSQHHSEDEPEVFSSQSNDASPLLETGRHISRNFSYRNKQSAFPEDSYYECHKPLHNNCSTPEELMFIHKHETKKSITAKKSDERMSQTRKISAESCRKTLGYNKSTHPNLSPQLIKKERFLQERAMSSSPDFKLLSTSTKARHISGDMDGCAMQNVERKQRDGHPFLVDRNSLQQQSSPFHQAHLTPVGDLTSLHHLMEVHKQLEEDSYCDGHDQDICSEVESWDLRQRLETVKQMQCSNRAGSIGSYESGFSNGSSWTEKSDVSIGSLCCDHDSTYFSSEDERSSPVPRRHIENTKRTPHSLIYLNREQTDVEKSTKFDHKIRKQPEYSERRNNYECIAEYNETESSLCQPAHFVYKTDALADSSPKCLRRNNEKILKFKDAELNIRRSIEKKQRQSYHEQIGESLRMLNVKEKKQKQASKSNMKSSILPKERKLSPPTSLPLGRQTTPFRTEKPVFSSPVFSHKFERCSAHHYDKEHHFKPHTYRGLQWCEYCGNFMWGLVQQGMQCIDCGLNVHKQCSKLVPGDCQPELKKVNRVFGVDLTTIVNLHETTRPTVIDKCVKEIEQRGMELDDIYEGYGRDENILNVKAAFDQRGCNTNLSSFPDICAIAGALKLYLRELPIPVIPYQLYSRFINAAKISQEDVKLDAIRMGLGAMPAAHFQTLKFLLQHLGSMSESTCSKTKEAERLGVAFGSILLRAPEKENNSLHSNDKRYQQEIIATMIKFSHFLFGTA